MQEFHHERARTLLANARQIVRVTDSATVGIHIFEAAAVAQAANAWLVIVDVTKSFGARTSPTDDACAQT